jgi:endoglucanase
MKKIISGFLLVFGTLLLAAETTNSSTSSLNASPGASSPPQAANYNPTGYFSGVNLSAGEFGKGNQLNRNYTYPTDAELAYFQGKGLKIVRIPFKWERVQPQMRGELDALNLAQLDRCVTTASRLHLVVLLDPHNYGGRNVGGKIALIGVDPQLSNDDFNDFWVKLANHYKDNPLVWFGLMNEPHKQTAVQVAATMQSAVDAIRSAGANNRILVPGTSWTGAHSWIKSGNGAAFANFKDPGNNFAFEVHQYLDKDNSGTHKEVVSGKGSTCLVAFTTWAREHHFKAFLGEAGWDGNPANTQANAEGDALLGYMDQNKDVWIGYTYWAAGPWWNNYMYSIEPTGLKTGAPVDRSQMSVLARHLD